jgi:hypothetical protein
VETAAESSTKLRCTANITRQKAKSSIPVDQLTELLDADGNDAISTEELGILATEERLQGIKMYKRSLGT